MRWFAPNAYGALVVPALRSAGTVVAVEGHARARVAVALGGGAAESAWRHSRQVGCPLIVYLWDLPPKGTGKGRYDPVWWLGGRFLRLPRPLGGYGRRRGYYSRLRYVAARADDVWVPSEFTRDTVERRFGVSATCVPYCYDSGRFTPGPPPPVAAGPERPVVLAVSRLQPHKNQAALIRACARLQERVQLRLIGRGPEAGPLRRLALALGVDCRVETDVGDADVVRACRESAVAVSASRFEGFGLGPIEAIACGLPAVASDIPPHREFVCGAATLVPLDDDAALARAIGCALRAPRPDPAAVGTLTVPAAAERIRSHLEPYLR
ncbi:MAG: glycosyltransferase [Gemmatimonadales bacterium]|nr:glycosyltransferase [Gemmatimonadales bacterium]